MAINSVNPRVYSWKLSPIEGDKYEKNQIWFCKKNMKNLLLQKLGIFCFTPLCCMFFLLLGWCLCASIFLTYKFIYCVLNLEWYIFSFFSCLWDLIVHGSYIWETQKTSQIIAYTKFTGGVHIFDVPKNFNPVQLLSK